MNDYGGDVIQHEISPNYYAEIRETTPYRKAMSINSSQLNKKMIHGHLKCRLG